MQPSSTLISFLKGQELFRSRPYLDPPRNTRGLHSTGYGHQIRPNEKYLYTKVLTEAEATAILLADVKDSTNNTNQALKRPASQGLFDALVDLSFNAGPGAMRKVANTWNTTGDIAKTAAHLQQYNKAEVNGALQPIQVLTNRRAHTAGWFSTAVGAIEHEAAKPQYLYIGAAVLAAIFIMNYLRNN